MKIFIVFFLLFVAISRASEEGISKSHELREMIEHEGTSVITLNATGYHYYLEELPRPYDVVIFFTADNCNYCDEIYTEYVDLAQMYKQNNAHYPNKDKKQRAVYFAKIVYTLETKDIFGKFNFMSVPNLFVSTPRMAKLKDAERVEYLKQFLWQITGTNGHVTSTKLLEVVNKKVGRTVEYKESIFNLVFVFAVFLVLGIIAYHLFFAFRKFFINNKLWFVGSIIIYFICMSGVVYNIIHNVPFTNIDRSGNFEWYHSGSRSQFGLEGYIMSGSIVIAGLLIVSYQFLPKFVTPGTTSMVTYLGVTFAAWVVIKFVEDIYHKKSGFYNPAFWPPAHYIKGPLMKDQGNNI